VSNLDQFRDRMIIAESRCSWPRDLLRRSWVGRKVLSRYEWTTFICIRCALWMVVARSRLMVVAAVTVRVIPMTNTRYISIVFGIFMSLRVIWPHQRASLMHLRSVGRFERMVLITCMLRRTSIKAPWAAR
jgi:hypothetical protein